MMELGNNKKLSIIVGVFLFLASAGISYLAFSAAAKGRGQMIAPEPQKQDQTGGKVINPSGPKDQVCPLNGAYYTQAEKDIWEQRRPLGVMIENHLDSRPQSGLSRADVVYEAVAEGGITRLLAIFYCDLASGTEEDYDIGPVRSARTYYLDWLSEYGDYPLYAHVGGAGECNDPNVVEEAKALCQIGEYGWLGEGTHSDLNQFALSYQVCRREYERTGQGVATEHTMYCDSYALWEEAAKRGLTAETKKTGEAWGKDFRSWLFKEDEPAETPTAEEIAVDFWSGHSNYDVTWQYNPENNTYRRFNGGEPFIDNNTGEQIEAKTIIVQFTGENGPYGELKHLVYDTIGSGEALVFQDGQAQKATWEKASRTARTLFFTPAGQEVSLNRGPIWIEVVPARSDVDY